MNKIASKLLFTAIVVGAGILTARFVFAETPQGLNITFPVAELGNCKNETECKAYCNKSENIDACIDFAQKNGLITADEANKAKQLKDITQEGGPGGCKGQNQCEAYCNDQSHIVECVDFAEKHNLMPSDELAEAKKVSEALKQGAQLPGNCKGKQQCQSYCKIPAHTGECLAFASKAGFIPSDQAEQARKMVELVQSGDAPQECLAGKDQCQQYCSETSHREQCADFMVKGGFMKQEDAEAFKKTGGKGPGGCQSKDECEAFCNTKENQQTCFQFGKENGLIPEEKLKQIEDGSQKVRGFIDNAPPKVKQCLQSTVGPDVLQEIESGKFMPNKDSGEQLGEQMKKCFEQFMPKNMQGPPGGEDQQRRPGGQGQSGPGNQGGMPPVGNSNNRFRGPGGCSSAEECSKYCSDPSHANECGSLGGEHQQGLPPGQEQNRPSFSPGISVSPPPGGLPPGSQPIQSIQPIQSVNPQMQQSSPPLSPPPSSSPRPSSPVSFVGSFFASILKFILGAR